MFLFDTPNNVKVALFRLKTAGTLISVGHGIYYYPQQNHGQHILPTLDEIAHAIAKRDGIKITPTGYHALNSLGLSAQVPMNPVYLTNGTAKKITTTKRPIIFKPAAPKNFQTRGKISGPLIKALKTLELTDLDQKEYNTIKQLLKQEQPAHIKHDLTLAPHKIRAIISKLM
jgi:hypothetical protein